MGSSQLIEFRPQKAKLYLFLPYLLSLLLDCPGFPKARGCKSSLSKGVWTPLRGKQCHQVRLILKINPLQSQAWGCCWKETRRSHTLLWMGYYTANTSLKLIPGMRVPPLFLSLPVSIYTVGQGRVSIRLTLSVGCSSSKAKLQGPTAQSSLRGYKTFQYS